MRPLEDTFADLNAALSTMSDQKKTAVLNEIFNKVDLKSVNALLGTSAERFDELSGYISNCAGAAAQMAETMDDNLAGDLTIMQSALEGLGIAAYEKFQEPFRKAVQEVTGYIGNLTKSMNSGELSSSMDKAAEGFRKIVSSVTKLLDNDVLPTLIKSTAWVVDNFNTLEPILIAVTTGVIAYQTATKAAAAAQALFTAALNVNPIILAASALAGLAVVIAEYVTETDTAIKTQKELEQSSEAIIAKSQAEANSAEYKAERYRQLYKQYKETGEASHELKLLAEDLQRLSPDTISLINEETGAYKELDESINTVIESLRRKGIEQAKQNTLQGHYDNISEYYQRQIKAERDYLTARENLRKAGITEADIADYEKSGGGKIGKTLDYTTYTSDGYYEQLDVLEEYRDALKERNEVLDETQTKIKEEQAAVEKLDAAYKDLYGDMTSETADSKYSNDYISAQRAAAEANAAQIRENMKRQAEDIVEAQKENTEKLKAGWENLNHAYAIGVITSEQELYAQKAALLEQYGNEELSEHWKYYEELYDQQQEFAENAKKAAEDAAKEEAEIRDQQWNDIVHRAEIGLLSAEDAYKEQLEWIQKYCPEYADEWYSYYKTIVDYQREALKEQVNGVKDSLSKTISEYKSAYAELESSVNSYKNRLLSVGDIFSITTETDENGNATTFYNVENLKKQMAEMQKYHDYVKQIKANGGSEALVAELTSYDFKDGMFFAQNLAGMSEAELKEISELQAEKEKLAADLANELYAPQMEQLNNDLVNSVIAEFGTLPEDIREIGAAALEAFIAGLSETEDLSEKVSDFTDSFFTACDEGISNGIAGLNLSDSIAAAFNEQDTYAIGKEKGDELVNGFNDALSSLYAQFEAELAYTAALTSKQSPQIQLSGTSASASDSGSGKTERIVLENHVNTTVKMDNEVVGKAAYNYEKEYERKVGG